MDNTLTHKTYKEYIDLRNDGKIVMYKRNDHNKKPKWNVRIKVPNTNGYVVKSTKTMDFNEGKRFSEDFKDIVIPIKIAIIPPVIGVVDIPI